MPESLFTVWNVVLMVLGFGFIVFVHEAGHFLAARWAGIRVHAFAIGFGKAILTYRKGWGIQRGSSEPRYMHLLYTVAQSAKAGASPDEIEQGREALKQIRAISPTEYRLNWIPFGGYVKMLGQEDLNPNATSVEEDSYQNKPVWKRMVVISAGVIMNVILAAILFVVVFKVGMSEPAPLVGDVQPGSPAHAAGLQHGDVIRAANNRETTTFTDLFVEVAMTRGNASLPLLIDRPTDSGNWKRLELSPTPERSQELGIQAIGVWPATGLTLVDQTRRNSVNLQNRRVLDGLGFTDVPFASRIAAIGGVAVEQRELKTDGFHGSGSYASIRLLTDAIRNSAGNPVRIVAESPEGDLHDVTLRPTVELQMTPSIVDTSGKQTEARLQPHLLGLAPVMRVAEYAPVPPRQGLMPGDVFKRLGPLAWPGLTEGVRHIRANKGSTIAAIVLRDGEEVPLELKVEINGTVGFTPSSDLSIARLAAVPALAEIVEREDQPNDFRPISQPPAAARLAPLESIRPGAIITAVENQTVTDFPSLREALLSATADAALAEAAASVTVELRTPAPAGEPIAESITLRLTPEEVQALHALRWEVPLLQTAFQPVPVFVQADSAFGAVGMGVARTKRVLQQTYLTFQRLFEGTVKVNQLQGPVGITHTGSLFAERGFIYLLYFMALISANLAVINFLPLPIVDGGQFLMLCYEGLAKKPVPIIVQNVITLGGLLFIGALFIFITFNDIVRLLGA